MNLVRPKVQCGCRMYIGLARRDGLRRPKYGLRMREGYMTSVGFSINCQSNANTRRFACPHSVLTRSYPVRPSVCQEMDCMLERTYTSIESQREFSVQSRKVKAFPRHLISYLVRTWNRYDPSSLRLVILPIPPTYFTQYEFSRSMWQPNPGFLNLFLRWFVSLQFRTCAIHL